MKFKKVLACVAISTSATLLMISCKKENTQYPSDPSAPEVVSNQRNAGVVEDDPSIVAKVPMIVSANFLTQNNNLSPVTALARGKADNSAPSISISSPTNAATVSGTVSVKISASDNVGVSSVSLNVDGGTVATTNIAPYTILWNSATVSNAAHTLTVTARDAAGNSRSVSIQVVVNNVVVGDITKPTVSITSPTNSSSVTGTINVGVSASDNVGVNSVKLSVDGTVINTVVSAPYNFSWNTSSLVTGIHSLTATATDAAGNTNTYSIQVTVNATVLPPGTIPTSFQLVTPTPRNQGGEGSCVAFAIGYGARSIEQYYRTNATGYSDGVNLFSPEYLYDQTKISDCGSGTAFTTVLELLIAKGVCTWQTMPYSDVNGCSLFPNATQEANASNYKIASYAAIPSTDQVAIKTMVSSKHPVIANITADNSFMNAGPGFVWRSYSGSGSLPHALVICGYDDTKHAYKVMNSWGTTWGDAGFSWIDYDFFPQKASYFTFAIQ